TGTVTVADPNGMITYLGAPTPISTIATACTQTATHTATWVLTLTAASQQLQLPVFVDATTGVEAAVGPFKIQFCLPPPDVPAGTPGRASFGIRLFHAKLTLNNVFTTPKTPNVYIWRAPFTPYTPTLGTPNTT